MITESDPLPNRPPRYNGTGRMNLRVLVNAEERIAGLRVGVQTAVLDADDIDTLVAALLDAKAQLTSETTEEKSK